MATTKACWWFYSSCTCFLQLRTSDDCQLHHDNSPSHAPHLVYDLFASAEFFQLSIFQVYFTTMFSFLLRLKSPFKGGFHCANEIKENGTTQMIAFTEDEFVDFFGKEKHGKLSDMPRGVFLRWLNYYYDNYALVNIKAMNTFRTYSVRSVQKWMRRLIKITNLQ